LAPWEGSVIQRGGVVMSTGGEATPGRGKGGGDVSWAHANLRSKNEEIHAVNSIATNRR
jgi:hypothetical protein